MTPSELEEHYRARLQELREFSPVDVIEEREDGWLVLAYWPGQVQRILIEPPKDRRRSGQPAVSQ